MKPKVQILTTCTHCDGDAYLPDREDISAMGRKYMRFKPCPMCQGSSRPTQALRPQVGAPSVVVRLRIAHLPRPTSTIF